MAVPLAPADDRAVSRFQAYLRMRTDHPSPEAGYLEAASMFKDIAAEIGLQFFSTELFPQHPIVLLKWAGLEPTLPSVVLNSHSDVGA